MTKLEEFVYRINILRYYIALLQKEEVGPVDFIK